MLIVDGVMDEALLAALRVTRSFMLVIVLIVNFGNAVNAFFQ